MILALLLLVSVDLEQQRLEAVLNPPREYRTVSGKKYWLEPHKTLIGITDPALANLKKENKTIYLVERDKLIKDKMQSDKMLPVYTHQGQLVVIDRRIAIKVKDKNHLQGVVDHCIANKLEVKKIDELIVYVSVTRSCPYVTSMEAGRSFEKLPGVEWSEVSAWIQLNP